MTQQYTTPENVQRELRVTQPFDTDTFPTRDTVLDIIEEVSDDIAELSNRRWSEEEYTEVLDYHGEDYLYLTNSPVLAIEELEFNEQRLGSEEGEEWVTKTENTHFFLNADEGAIGFIFTRFKPRDGYKRFRVRYTAGYENVPARIRMLATKIAALRVLETALYQNVNERDSGGSISIGSVSIIEPANYGVGTFKQLRDDIEKLTEKITNGSGVYRYARWESPMH